MIARMLGVAALLLGGVGPAVALEETPESLAGVLNYRAYDTTFASAGQPTREQLEAVRFLYRVIHKRVLMAEAKADMNTVWQPNETWRDFIFDVLARHDVSPHGDGCDWTPSVTD